MSSGDRGPDELWSRFCDGDPLAPDEARALLERLEADGGIRGTFLRDAEIDGLLRGLADARAGEAPTADQVLVRLAAERDRDAFVERTLERTQSDPGRHVRWRRWAVAAVGATALAAALAGAFALGRRDGRSSTVAPHEVAHASPEEPAVVPDEARAPGEAPAVATIRTATGVAFVIEGARKIPAEPGREIRSGQGLLTVGTASAVTLRYGDDAQIDVGGDTVLPQLAAAGPERGYTVFLALGTLRAHIGAGPQGAASFVFTTPHAEAAAVATRLSLAVTPRASEFDVGEGRVQLTRGGTGPETVVSAGQHAVVSQSAALSITRAVAGTATLVVGGLSLSPGDRMISDRLRSLGFAVKVRGSAFTVDAELRQSAVIVLSSSIDSADATTPLHDLAVPIVVWESALFDELGLTAAEEEHGAGVSKGERGEVVIKNPGHPLAAGLSGTVQVTDGPADLRWGTPAPLATWVATLPGTPTRAAVFAYETGAPLVAGSPAPARRVGLFLNDVVPQALTDAGWSLFDAAIRWCSGR